MTTSIRARALLLATLVGFLLLSGCSTVPTRKADTQPPMRTYEKVVGADNTIHINDPWEGFNRGAYRFNYFFDKFLFLPIVNTYEFIMPDYAQKRVSNFVDNIYEFNNFTNNLLQLKIKKTGITLTRFVINSTVGIAGLWDPATSMEIHRHKEDFGQTLGHYGVGNGPYLVLPILGPSNLRDATGTLVDSLALSAVANEVQSDWMDDNNIQLIFGGVVAIDTRHRVSFRYHGTGSPFEYDMIRMLYTSKREIEIDD